MLSFQPFRELKAGNSQNVKIIKRIQQSIKEEEGSVGFIGGRQKKTQSLLAKGRMIEGGQMNLY